MRWPRALKALGSRIRSEVWRIVMQATRSASTRIGLAEIFPQEAIVVGLVQHTKRGVVEELVHHLVKLGRLAESEEKAVVGSILAREKMGSTALGNGIAFPNCRSNFTDKFIGVLGFDPRGVPFDSVDGEHVHSIFLVLAPLDGREEHYEVLGRITAIGRDKSRRAQLRGCRSAEAVHDFLQELDRC
jgi:mannitol/fructose-specific phosphotransferase system IIA component (Ntr-type)